MKNIKKVLIFVLFVFASVLALNLSVKAAAGDVYKLVTDAATLAAGDEVIIANAEGNRALSTTQNKNNRGEVAVTKSGDSIAYVEGLQVLTLEAGKKSGTFALSTGSGYLYAASSSSNYLRTEATLSDNSSWAITIADGVATIKAQGTNTRNWLRYNSSSKLFAAYGSGQVDVAIYKKAAASANATQLAAPTIAISNKTLSWSAVNNATGYVVDIYNGETLTASYNTDATTYDLSNFKSQGTWSIKVKASGDGVNYLISDYSNAVSLVNSEAELTVTPTEFLNALDPVGNITFTISGIVSGFYNSSYEKVEENTWDNSYENVSFYLSDGTNEVLCYRVEGDQGKTLRLNDQVTIKGNLGNYKGVNQLAQKTGVYVSVVTTATPLEIFAAEDTKTSMILNYKKTALDLENDTIFAYEFTDKVFSDENSALESNGVKWNLNVVWGTAEKSYGFDSQNGRGQQIGSSKKPATSFTLTTESAVNGIKSLELNASGASGTDATVTVTVGGVQLGQTVSLTSSATVYRFTSETALNGAVEIAYSQTTSKAFYVGAINIYKEAASESLTSASMRFGTVISKAMYDELVASGATAWGVEIKAGDANATQIACTPVRVNENGVEDANGEFYQFALVINKIGYANIDTVLTAKVFVEINNTKTYMNEASHSLRTLVDTYLAANDKSAYEDHLGVLNHLSSYGK